MTEYKKDRSKFWLKIYDENNVTLCCSKITKMIINNKFSNLKALSPNEWKKSSKYNDMYTLWIPNANIDYTEIESLKTYAEHANNHIWLKINKNIEEYFDGDELDFCICNDWNYDFNTKKRTYVGEAEYQLKYCKNFSKENRTIMTEALKECLAYVPFTEEENIVTTIPAPSEDQNHLSWILGEYVADYLKSQFLITTLTLNKPQMKGKKLQEKLGIWRTIYSNNNINLSIDIKNKPIIIVDDLYQSGTSMWCYAEYLKSLGAKNVIGICSVKAMRDGDNS